MSVQDNTERLTAACLLSVAGGFLDIYTYLFRGRVFANAVTGNMVLFGYQLAEMQWLSSLKYLLAILSYAAGVFAAESLHNRLPKFANMIWHQLILLLEISCLLIVFFIPQGRLDFAVNALIAFVCAMQVQTFRRVHGLPFASTMCTGNLRSGTEALFRGLICADTGGVPKALHYYGVIVCFISGAVIGAILLKNFGMTVLLLVPACLLTVFFLTTSRRQLVQLRRFLKRKKNPEKKRI